jgi:perosamine synthetase
MVVVVLPYGRQDIDDDDIAAVVAALRAPLLTCGPLVERFEHALGAAVGVAGELVSACSSGTAALHLAYAALDLGPGDEIITTPVTFSATAAAAYYVGATVRIADVDPHTGNLDPTAVARLITPRTRAIVPVHLAGQPADLAELVALARGCGAVVIEDACHALGASYRGVVIGGDTGSDAVVFSFHPVKHVTTGEGGAIVVRTPDIKRRIDRLRHHGIERSGSAGPRSNASPDALRSSIDKTPAGAWAYEVRELGWNYRLPDINCALGISQLAKLERFVARRRAIAARYRAALAGIPNVACPPELADRESAYHLFAVAIDFATAGTTRAAVMAALAAAGIGSQVHYPPLLVHPLHRARCAGEIARPRPGCDRYAARTLSLPMFPAMTDGDVDRVAAALATALATATSAPAATRATAT